MAGKPAVNAMSWFDVTSNIQKNGDMPNSYTEELSAGDLTVQMTWLDLQAPMAIEVGPDASATKEHDMYAVFLEANDAQISINGNPLQGQVVSRQFFGRTMSTAFLALSETWVSPR